MADPAKTISYVTVANEEEGRKLARWVTTIISNRPSKRDKPGSTNQLNLDLRRSLVENRLAACVNIVKEVKSIYEWQGKIEEEAESMLIIKSDASKTTQLTQFVESNHSYDCPEVVTMKVS